jgi:hypothetical protein
VNLSTNIILNFVVSHGKIHGQSMVRLNGSLTSSTIALGTAPPRLYLLSAPFLSAYICSRHHSSALIFTFSTIPPCLYSLSAPFLSAYIRSRHHSSVLRILLSAPFLHAYIHSLHHSSATYIHSQHRSSMLRFCSQHHSSALIFTLCTIPQRLYSLSAPFLCA